MCFDLPRLDLNYYSRLFKMDDKVEQEEYDDQEKRRKYLLKRIDVIERQIDQCEIALQHWKIKNGYFLWGSACRKPTLPLFTSMLAHKSF